MTRRIVIPGEVVTEERRRLGMHVYMQNGKIHSDVLGLADVGTETVNVIPLEGRYMPKQNDLVLGVVSGERFGGYEVDINTVSSSFLSNDKVRDRLRLGSIVSVKVVSVNELNEAEIDNVRVLYGGNITTVDAVKVPRLIGKNGSMLEVLKKGTGCSMLVGRNGRIWTKGGNFKLLVDAVNKISREAHMENLTNRMAEYLEKHNKQPLKDD